MGQTELGPGSAGRRGVGQVTGYCPGPAGHGAARVHLHTELVSLLTTPDDLGQAIQRILTLEQSLGGKGRESFLPLACWKFLPFSPLSPALSAVTWRVESHGVCLPR